MTDIRFFFDPACTRTWITAVELWDVFVVLGKFEGLYEIKRTRNTRPIFTPLPATSL
jgi:hypothetical protein